jgi:excisionase family DNA binding protein
MEGSNLNVERLYTVQEAADYLSCTKAAIYKWMKEGRLRYVEIGLRGRRVPESALQDFLRDPHTQSSRSQETEEENSLALPLAA